MNQDSVFQLPVCAHFVSILEASQGQIDGFFSQLPFKYNLPEVASVGDFLKICPWVASRVGGGGDGGAGGGGGGDGGVVCAFWGGWCLVLDV